MGDADMIVIAYSSPDKWPVTIESAKQCSPELATPDIRSVMCSGDDLALVKLEFDGLPIMRHTMDWLDGPGITWWWGDAAFIVNNIQQAYNINKVHNK